MFTIKLCTADCKSLATSKLKSGKPQLCLNREVGHAEAGKIIISYVVNQLWFPLFQLACCKTFAICCTPHLHNCSQLEMVFMHEQNLLEENVHVLSGICTVLTSFPGHAVMSKERITTKLHQLVSCDLMLIRSAFVFLHFGSGYYVPGLCVCKYILLQGFRHTP